MNKKRLIPLKMLRTKIAAQKTITLQHFISRSGLYYGLDARLLGGKIFYSITQQSEFSTSSLYDGQDYEKAFQIFCELAIAIKGISYAETIASKKEYLLSQSDKLIEQRPHTELKLKSLMLGDSDAV